MTKRTPKPPPPPTLPATLLDDQVFETLAHEFDKFVAQIRGEDSHRHWQLWMRKLVREGERPLRWLIELTHDKEAAIDADAALRDMAEEMLERREQPPVLLQSYLISHHAKPARGKGRCEGDTFLRDQVIAVIVAIARERWSMFIPMTRKAAEPSICSIVSRICRDRGIEVGEKRVKQIYDRFAAFLPVHQGWLMLKSSSPAI